MQNKYRAWLFTIIFYMVAILGLCLSLSFVYVVFAGLSGGTEIFQAPLYFRTLGNISFFAGALVFTFGAFLEFFVKARSPSIGRTMMLPHEIWSKRFALEDKDREARLMDESSSGGWMLIAIGALAIIASAAFAFISMK